MKTYKQALTDSMTELATDPKVCFVGYGVKYGGMAAGTLKGVNPEQLIETPVAENLMVGLAIGLALAGRRPVVYIERFDFILNALDAIVNHLDKIAPLSQGQFHPAVILRVVAGNKRKPLFTGITHTQDFTSAMCHMVNFPIVRLENPAFIEEHYRSAHNALKGDEKCPPTSTLFVEMKDLI